MIFGFNPWQFLLYLMALEMILAPFIIAIFNGYFKAKYTHVGNIISSIAKAFANAFEEMTKTLEAKIKAGKKE